MQAVILAGGLGTRLNPLTKEMPKPMITVANKPLLDYSIDLLKKHGITDIGITVRYLPQYIKDYLGNGEYRNVKIKYFSENIPLGTAGSVKQAENDLDDTFVVLSGDALTNTDLSKVLLYHRSIHADVTIVAKEETSPLEFGVVEIETDGRVVGFNEKPLWENVKSNTVNTGIYIINKEILDYIPKDKEFDFSKDLFPLLLKENKRIYGYISEKYWCDIGTPDKYLSANFDLLNGNFNGKKADIITGENIKISDETVFLPPVSIADNVEFTGKNVIGPNVVIGSNSIINNCKISKSVIWQNAEIENCDFSDTIIGNNTKIEGAVLSGNNIIGSDAVLKQNSHIRYGIKVYNNVYVPAEAVVSENMTESNMPIGNVFENGMIIGRWNKKITDEMLKGIAGSYFYERIAVAYNRETGNIAHLLASYYSLNGATVYIINGKESSIRYFSCINNIPTVFVDEKNGNLIIQFIDSNGLNISSQAEKKITFTAGQPIRKGKIVKFQNQDAKFEFFLNSSFPMMKNNVSLMADDTYSVHNVIFGQFKNGASVHSRNGSVTDVFIDGNRLSVNDFLKLKIDLTQLLGEKEVFLPECADKEITDYAESKNIFPLKTFQHKGNTMQQTEKFISVACLLEFEPAFFALAYCYFKDEIQFEKSSSKIAKFSFNCMPEETSKIIKILNDSKQKYSEIISIVPQNNGYSFAVYGKYFNEEYAPDFIENFVNDSLDNSTK